MRLVFGRVRLIFSSVDRREGADMVATKALVVAGRERLTSAGWRRWLLLLWCLALPAGAAPAAPEEGLDYNVVEAPAKRAGPGADGRVEVVEFFWYQCPHCNALTALIEPWAQRQRQRVRFVRMPLALNAAYAAQDKLYFALEELGQVERLHPLVFQAIHEDGVKLKTVAQMAEFMREEGVPRARFEKAMRSPRVRAGVAHARALASHYRIAEVPTLLVDGRYLTSAGHVGGSQADAIAVVEWLVRRVEEERRANPR
jgi:thiol:disulfide interchange protein DsbA